DVATRRQGHAPEMFVINAPVNLVIFATPAHPLLVSKPRAPFTTSALDGYPVFISDAAGDFRLLLDPYFQNGRLPGSRVEFTGSVEGVKAGVVRASWCRCATPLCHLARTGERSVLCPADEAKPSSDASRRTVRRAKSTASQHSRIDQID